MAMLMYIDAASMSLVIQCLVALAIVVLVDRFLVRAFGVGARLPRAHREPANEARVAWTGLTRR